MSNNTTINVTFPQKNNIDVGIPGGKRKDIYEIKSNKKTTMDNVTDEDEQYLSAGGTKKLVEAKEDVSNKIITEDEVPETAPYFSAEATKEYVAEQLSELDKIRIVDISMSSIDSFGSKITGEFTSTQIFKMAQNGEFVILRVNIEDIDTVGYAYPINKYNFIMDCNYITSKYEDILFIPELVAGVPNYNGWTVAYGEKIAEESPESETVVVNLSIGDYETVADKSPSEVYQLYKEGKNVVLSFKYGEYNEASSSWTEREDIYKLIGFIGGNKIIFASQDLHDSLQFTYVTAYMDDDTWGMTKRDDNVKIIDNLESTDTNAALSANQGRVLNEKIGDIETALDGLHAYAQGIVSGGDA